MTRKRLRTRQLRPTTWPGESGKVVNRIIQFCRDNSDELRNEQASIRGLSGLHYPLMKLADMYFWQIGFERWEQSRSSLATQVPPE